MNLIDHPYKGDDHAEYHPITACKFEDELVCMVCGEAHPHNVFKPNEPITCQDCGIYLEEVCIPSMGVFLVHYTDETNATCAEDFYNRFRDEC